MPNIEIELWTKRNGAHRNKLELLKNTNLQITCTTDAEIKVRMSASISNKFDLNYSTDTLVPYYTIDGDRRQLGEFVISSSNKITESGNTYYNISAFDITYFLKKYRTEGIFNIAAGTLYTTAIASILTRCNIYNYRIDESTLTVQEDREDWEPGTPYITILNQLLNEINYNSVYLDSNAITICERYSPPSSERINIAYKNDKQTSILYTGSELEIDAFDHANVFYYVTDNPETETQMIAVAENNDPTNIFSTVNQGRIVQYTNMDNVASQEILQDLANKAVTESMFSSDTITFRTGIDFIHQPFFVIELVKNEFEGIVYETGWTMTLGIESSFEHIGKQVTV